MVEWKFIKEARDKGLVAFGSRGSHSPIDIVIIEKDGTVHLYQLKSTILEKITENTFKNELKEFKKIKVKGVKHFWVCYRGRKKSIPKWIFKWNE